MKKNITTLICAIFIFELAQGEGLSEKKFYGMDGAEISMSMWDEHVRSWTYIEHRNGENIFPVYQLSPNAVTPSFAADAASGQNPAGNKFLALQRTELGEFLNEEGDIEQTEKTYCDILDVSTGCVLLSRSAEYCSGSWVEDKWLRDNGELVTVKLETPSPEKIIRNVGSLKGASRAGSIREYMYMGVDSYLACYPPKKKIQTLNDLAFFLAEGGDNYNAMKLYRELEKISPSRVVLKLNIADALWMEGKQSEARGYYSSYKSLMEKNGRGKLVPEHVIDRLEKKQANSNSQGTILRQ